LRYRAQAPVLDGLMKELGFDGGSLDSLVKGAAEASQAMKSSDAAPARSTARPAPRPQPPKPDPKS